MVGAFQFGLWRLLRNESKLSALSADQNALFAELSGKTVALVGNSRALAETSNGAKIDANDIVIRINRAPMPSAQSHGRRTTWLALAVAIDQKTEARTKPKRILWMSHKRKRLARNVALRDGFYLFPLADWAALKATLGAPPSTGAMMVWLLAQSNAAKIDLFGFDFFASKSLTGSRDAKQVPHDFASEKRWIQSLMKNDARFSSY